MRAAIGPSGRIEAGYKKRTCRALQAASIKSSPHKMLPHVILTAVSLLNLVSAFPWMNPEYRGPKPVDCESLFGLSMSVLMISLKAQSR
jgi:hypothetical protein